MSRRKSNANQSIHPSLFDQPPMPRLPFGEDDTIFGDLPIHPSISRDAGKMAMERRARANSSVRETRSDDIFGEVNVKGGEPPLMFMSFGSGSSGNCSYIGNRSKGFLIDAGVNSKHVVDTLMRNAITMDSIVGICLTHDHSDHILHAYDFLRKYRHLKLFCTPKTLNGALRRHNVSKNLSNYHSPIYKEFPFKIGPFEVVAFNVIHDGTDNCGYFISYQCGEHKQTMAIATDLGSVTDRVDYYMRQAEHIVIESNYDELMLARGRYPERLKDRIRGGSGHLSNSETALYLSRIYTPALRDIFLCHLSADNNTPQLALAEVRKALLQAGVVEIGEGRNTLEDERAPLQLSTLPRYDSSRLFVFSPRINE